MGYPKRRIPKSWRNVTNREYLYGDFDRDKIPNIDDKRPFDPTVAERVEAVSLSRELRLIERYNRAFGRKTKNVAQSIQTPYGKVQYRVKGVYSTIGKLRRFHLQELEDIGGVRVLVKKTSQVKQQADFIKKMWPMIREEDYYKAPKGGYYMAHHLTVSQGTLPIEVQVKTFGMSKLHELTHPYHKKGKEPPFNAVARAMRILTRESR